MTGSEGSLRTYEAVLIYSPQAAAGFTDGGKSVFESILKTCNGKIEGFQDLGRKPLGHPVKKMQEGFFAVAQFSAAPAEISALKRTLELNDQVLKYMITVVRARQHEPRKPAPHHEQKSFRKDRPSFVKR